MIRLACAVITAVLFGLFNMSNAAAATPPAESPTVNAYNYDHIRHAAPPTHTTTERGPPDAYDRATALDAVDNQPRGVLARSNAAEPGATTTYATQALFVQVARATGTTSEQARLADGETWSVTLSHVAANGGGGASRPFAMGIKDHLDDFAGTHGADTWKSLPESAPGMPADAWRQGVLRKLRDPDQRVLFNLDDVDVWPGVTRAASGRGGATDWELLQLRGGGFPNLEFWQGGVRVGNPFE